jgi:hypothetical protein
MKGGLDRVKILSIWITPKERREIEESAARNGRSLSDHCRVKILCSAPAAAFEKDALEGLRDRGRAVKRLCLEAGEAAAGEGAGAGSLEEAIGFLEGMALTLDRTPPPEQKPRTNCPAKPAWRSKRGRVEPLTARVNVRLGQGEMKEVGEAAEAAGLPVSRYSRRKVLGRVVYARPDLTLVNELSRFGGLMKLVRRERAGVIASLADAARETAAGLISVLAERAEILSGSRAGAGLPSRRDGGMARNGGLQ